MPFGDSLDSGLVHDVKTKLDEILGPPGGLDYRERLTAVLSLLGHHEMLMGTLEFRRDLDQDALLAHSAENYLLACPQTQIRAKSIVAGYLAGFSLMFAKQHDCDQQVLYRYAKGLVHWALFESDNLDEGLRRLRGPDELPVNAKWIVTETMIEIGIWKIKKLLPIAFEDPGFFAVRTAMLNKMYGCFEDFWKHFSDLRPFETALPPADRGARLPGKKIRVGVLLSRVGSGPSSAMMLNSWLMNLPAADIDVVILDDSNLLPERKRVSERNSVRRKYFELYGANLVDSSAMDDAALIAFAREKDFDVVIQSHNRSALSHVRLGRCHLEVFADVSMENMADLTVLSENMLLQEFADATARRFVVIPEPYFAVDRLPDAEITERVADEPFCFGVFSRPLRFHDALFDMWAEILHACPSAQLLMTGAMTFDRTLYPILSSFAARRIDPSRILIGPRMSHREHLARHNRVDLLLDTFPIYGGLTVIDAFYMGVPALFLEGDLRPYANHRDFFRRIGTEGGAYATTPAEYVAYAKSYYDAGPRPKAARERLRESALTTFFDQERMTHVMRDVIRAAARPTQDKITRIAEPSLGAV